ncbi:hypothetical protein TNCV_2261771 [Trichonephila clavipes]|nr:hypothetical protein TNCV_2261771 [Trichonephila clavipes]
MFCKFTCPVNEGKYSNPTDRAREIGLYYIWLLPLESSLPREAELYVTETELLKLRDALFICYKQSPDNVHSVAYSQRSSSPRLIEDETFNNSDIINYLINYEDGQEFRFFESG